MKMIAFIKRDFLIEISYRLNLFLQLGRRIFSLLIFYFIGETFSGAISPHINHYGGDYFSYALIGIAVSSFVTAGLYSLANEVINAQTEGTLEALLSTPTSIYTVLIGNSLWPLFKALLETVLMISFGIVFLGFQVSVLQVLSGLFVLLLTLLAFLTIGMLSASFIMIFKQGDPINLVFGASSYLLGGVIFPVEVLPLPFQYIAEILPVTHAVKALRELFLAQIGFDAIIPYLFNLIIFILILSPISILFFRYAVNRAKHNGSLIQY